MSKLKAFFSPGCGRELFRALQTFGRNTRGNVAMMFGIALPILVMVCLGAIDIHQASRVKANLQDALDAAALAAARSTYTDADNLSRVGMDALKANMPDYFKDGSLDTATFTLEGNTLIADARVNVKVLVANIVLPPYGQLLDDLLPVSSHSEVLRASRNVEVAMALDITQSMAGTPLTDLKAAAKELVEIVVQDQQTPFYSKIGLVPYGAGVNLGSRAAAARGAIPAAIDISDASWKTADAAKNISGISRASPGVITSSNHGFKNGDYIMITGVRGMTQINGYAYQVYSAQTNSFQVRRYGQGSNLNTSGYSSYSSNGQIQKCQRADCSVVITANGHGLSNGSPVWIDGMQGLTNLNKASYLVSNVTTNTFNVGVAGTANYTGGGQTWCASLGCQWYRFTNAQNATRVFEASSCVSERTGSDAYKDVAPSVSRVGHNYPSTRASCSDSEVLPMTSTRSTLTKAIDDLVVSGSTAGQIGIAWAWYMVNPNFASFWGGDAAPAENDSSKTLKVVVLMTDGDFNTPFCNGVVASDASVGNYVGSANMINCKATNGDPFTQSVQLCEAMKQTGVIVYTVAFDLGTNRGGAGVDTAIEVMETCATDTKTHFHNTSNGADLKDAFRAIGRDITRLRIAR